MFVKKNVVQNLCSPQVSLKVLRFLFHPIPTTPPLLWSWNSNGHCFRAIVRTTYSTVTWMNQSYESPIWLFMQFKHIVDSSIDLIWWVTVDNQLSQLYLMVSDCWDIPPDLASDGGMAWLWGRAWQSTKW